MSGEQVKAKRPRQRRAKAGEARRTIVAAEWIALAAFLLSLTTALSQMFLAARGPVIKGLPLEQAVIYGDPPLDPNGVVTIAVRASQVNTASQDYGDLVTHADLALVGSPAVRFSYEGMIHPHLLADASQAPECELDARCVRLTGMNVVDRDEKLISLPGGGARSDYLAFTVGGPGCAAAPGCAQLSDFARAGKALDRRPLKLKLTLDYNRARTLTLECVTGPVNGDWFRKYGWTSLVCAPPAQGAKP